MGEINSITLIRMNKRYLILSLTLTALCLVGAGCTPAASVNEPINGQPAAAVQPEAQPARQPDAANNNPTGLLGGDRDAHGCIGSAGYTWCEAKSKCLRSWEEECFASAEEGIRYALAAKYGKPMAEVTVKIDQQQGNDARGQVSFGEDAKEGGIFLAEKVNGQWLLAYDGNGSVNCQDLKTNYAFPADMLKGICD